MDLTETEYIKKRWQEYTESEVKVKLLSRVQLFTTPWTAWSTRLLHPVDREYREELYKQDLQDPDNHEGTITHLKPDILESKVKWALGSITT